MRYRLHADAAKHIHSRSSSPQRRRLPLALTHAVAVGGQAELTVCGLATRGLHAFPDLDFEESPGQMKCPTCRELVARA